ncbi:uncharacterized protein LOC105848137 isoform X1 [Hydra vulgaris]|uniref:uncharacterized protein LOC105848137 isoform X1 n=1 Tax=Hydra vulgaris TaxID=6087 RepID=UPI0006418035
MFRRVNINFECLIITIYALLNFTIGHEEFSVKECLSAHNELRKLHIGTEDLVYSSALEKIALDHVNKLTENDDSYEHQERPRVLPKRRKRHASDVDTSIHIENWDGRITFPRAAWDRNFNTSVRIGESIHKFCCQSEPHCPKRFFHNLLFPPSAKGVVYDWYTDEIKNYDFKSGTAKLSTADISHFSSIVWKNTKSIGCAQSKIVSKCVFTIVIYEVEGGVGTENDFKNNIAPLDTSNKVLLVSLLTGFGVLIIVVALLGYRFRENIRWKYVQFIIKVDTLKSEQELETDSTRFWWLRLFKKSRVRSRKSTLSRPKNKSLKERPTIEVIVNTVPQRSVRRPLPLPPKLSNPEDASKMAVRYKGISQKAPNLPGVYIQSTGENNGSKFRKQPSLSGKPHPPPNPPEKTKEGELTYQSDAAVVHQPSTSTPIPKTKPKPDSVPLLDKASDESSPSTVKGRLTLLENKNKELPAKKPLIPPKKPGSNM